MGGCSSPSLLRGRTRDVRQPTPSCRISSKTQRKNLNNFGKDQAGSKEKSTPGKKQNQEGLCSPLSAMGQIWTLTTDINSQPLQQCLGVGCLIASRILLASDHYLYYYQPQGLIFKPFDRTKGIKVLNCIYPPPSALPSANQRKKSMYMHRRVNFALFLLEDSPIDGQFLQLGTSLLSDDIDEDSLEFQSVRKTVIEQTSRCLFLHVTVGTRERGWPLLYLLHGKYYCIGLYSYPHTSDSLLLHDRMVQRFKMAEKKYTPNSDQINSVEINEAQLQKWTLGSKNNVKSILDELLQERQGISQGMDEQLADLTFRIGIQYGYSGNFQQERQHYQTAFQLYKKAGLPLQSQSMATLHHNLGICQTQLGNFPSALQHLSTSLQIRSNLEESQAMADTYNELGVLSRKQGLQVEALSYYYKAYNIYSELEHFERMAMILNNITLLTQDQHSHTANKAKYKDILAILQRTKGENCIEVAKVMFNLGVLQSQGKNYGTAINALGKAARIMKGLGLQQHCYYRAIGELVKDLDGRIEEQGERREWALKSKALLALI